MEDHTFVPVSTTKLNNLIKWFADLQDLLVHPHLNDEMRFLWVWLTAQTVAGLSFSCVISYEDIAQRLKKPLEDIHYCLLRLRISGFLVADIPVYFGDLTPEMIQEVRTINLIYPHKRYYKKPNPEDKKKNEPVLPKRTEQSKKEEIIPPEQSSKRKPKLFLYGQLCLIMISIIAFISGGIGLIHLYLINSAHTEMRAIIAKEFHYRMSHFDKNYGEN